MPSLPTPLDHVSHLNINWPKDLVEDVAAALIKVGISVHDFFEKACTVTGEWTYERSKARLKDRIHQKFCNERSVPLKFRTLVECLDPQPDAQVVFRRLLDWIDRCDVASQHGLPKPQFQTPDGSPIFPEDEDDAWWLTDVSKQRATAEDKVMADEDGPATEDDEVEECEKKDVSDDDPLSENEEIAASSSRQHDPIVAWPAS